MYEYKVIKTSVNSAEEEINAWAKKGYRVVTVSPNIAKGMGVIITLEKKSEE